MGYTPLEGLIMATRVGNIDAGALIKLSQAKNLSLFELEEYLNTQSGLLGLSELSDDIRKLLELENEKPQAKLALSAYVNSIKKYIGAYTAILNGLDLLVFSATIGERSSTIRERICANLDGLGIHLDQSVNNHIDSTDAIISTTDSPVTVAVLTTNEMQAIAQQIRPLFD
jgi:acetate kinase